MKIKKTIEVEKCDLCGIEGNHLIKCGHCEKEICSGCNSYATVIVRNLKPNRMGEAYATDIETPIYKYSNSFCRECSGKVIEILEQTGLISSEDEENYTVLDY